MTDAMRTLALALLAACGGSGAPAEDAGVDAPPGPACEDPDGDGYGVGDGCLGEDCREDDALLQQCVCDPDGVGTGCTCELAEPVPCFDGPVDEADVGVCHVGLRRCEGGRWSVCDGQVLATPEDCDGEDDDCDGVVDDGVLSACGDCNPNCQPWSFGEGGEAFAADTPEVTTTRDGALTLAAGASEGSVVLRLEVDDFCTYWRLQEVQVHVPEGASVLIEVQGGYEPAWAPWFALPGETPLPVFTDFETAVLELRITLRATPEGLAPTVDSLTLISVHSYCG